jgi:hypothetical protein
MLGTTASLALVMSTMALTPPAENIGQSNSSFRSYAKQASPFSTLGGGSDTSAILKITGFNKGIGGAIAVNNADLGGTYDRNIYAGHLDFEYQDTNGVRGAGQFADGSFETFCMELQDVSTAPREYTVRSIADAPIPAGGNLIPPYDEADEAELNAALAAAVRLGWINADLSSNADTTNLRRAAIQGLIWQVLFDGASVEATSAEIGSAMAALITEAAAAPSATIPGLHALTSPVSQDILFVVDETAPDLDCEAVNIDLPVFCDCDLNRDGTIDGVDSAAFLDAFAMGDADYNGDGVTSTDDLLDFLACFFDTSGGCGEFAQGADCCEDANGDETDISAVRLQYTAEDCSDSSNSQNDDKWNCEGDTAGDPDVYILVTNKEDHDDHRARVWFAGDVSLGQSFLADAANEDRNKLSSKTFVHIYADFGDAEPAQSIEFHTSCSQPLFAGDTFGAVRVIGCIDEDGNPTGGGDGPGDPGYNARTFEVVITASDDTDAPDDITVEAIIETECEQIPVMNGDIVELRCFDPADQTSGDICDFDLGKPVNITLTYTGEGCDATVTAQDPGKFNCDGDPQNAQAVYITITDDEDPDAHDARLFFEGDVMLGDSFVAMSENAGETKFRSKTFGYVCADASRTTLLQSIEFHTSCSQPIRIGDQYGSMQINQIAYNDAVFGGDPAIECGSEYIDGVLVITAMQATLSVVAIDSSGNATVCETILCEEPVVQEDCCADGNKPTALELRYTGEDCSATTTQQDDDKYNCVGDPAFAPDVFIISTDSEDPSDNHADVYFAGEVALDETFIISAQNAGEDKFSSRTYVHIFDADTNDLLQSIEFHTSCSQPLFTGDQYGSIQIVACPEPEPSDSCCVDGHKPIELDFRYTAASCADSSNAQGDAFTCEGDTEGMQDVFIIVSDDEDPHANDAEIYFLGNATLNEVITASAANAGEDKFRSNSYIHILTADCARVLQTVRFHTSCSKPLNVGDTYGAAELVACRSE